MTSIIILGMHRSGTSCLAGSLQEQGLWLGNVNNQAPHNKKGNKENKQTWLINDYVLQLSEASWDKPPEQLHWDEAACVLRDEFIDEYTDRPLWGFKDPRTVLTLPFWLDALKEFRLCATFRHPMSVAQSLKKRNGFELDQSLDLWNHYNRLILSYADRFDVSFINFDWEVTRYKKSIRNMAICLNLPYASSSQENSFLDPSLKHQSYEFKKNDVVPKESMDIYQRLCEISKS